MTAPFASANEIARALVAASRIIGADPLEVADNANAGGRNMPISRARYLAFAALRDVLPDCDQWAIARGLGFKSQAAAVSNLHTTRRTSGWWREDWVLRVADAIRAGGCAKQGPEPTPAPAPTPSAPVAAPNPVQTSKNYSNFIPPAPVAASPKKQHQPSPKMDDSHWLIEGRCLGVGPSGTVYRKTDGSTVVFKPSRALVHLGEPSPERSALAQRNGAARLPCEDDKQSARAPRPVTLPKLKFMEGRER